MNLFFPSCKKFLAALPTVLTVGIFIVTIAFFTGVPQTFAAPLTGNGDINVHVTDELSNTLSGALVGVGCVGGGIQAITYTDVDGNMSAAAGTFVNANCDNGETITVSVYKPGFVTDTSFTATYHTDADNGTYNVTGVKYALKTVGLKSEAGGTIMSLANGSSSSDVTLTPSAHVTVYSSVVRDEGLDGHPVVYIAATGTGEGDTLIIQLQNASADGGGADVAQFVKKVIDVSSMAGAPTQKTIDIENGAEGGDINTATGFEYPLSVQVADQLGNGINISALSTPPNLGGFGYYATNGANKMYFTNVLSHQNLNIINSGYVNATVTNAGLLGVHGGVTTSLDTATHLLLGPAAANADGITAGQGGDAGTAVKGLEFGAVLTALTDELGNDLIDINPDQDISVKTGDDVGVSCLPSLGQWYCPFPAGVSGLIQVSKDGFIKNTSFRFTARTSDASVQSHAAVSGVLYGMKITKVQNEIREDIMPESGFPFYFLPFEANPSICDESGMNPGSGEQICQGTYLYSETFHDSGAGNKAWYLAVKDTDIGASHLVAEIRNYVTRSTSDLFPDPTATTQQMITFTPDETYADNTWLEAPIQFPLRVHLGDELGNTLSYKNPVMTYDENSAHYNASFDSSDFYFAHAGNNKALSVSLDGFVDLNLAVDSGFADITTDTNTQTFINLSGSTPNTVPVSIGAEVTGSGLQYGLKVNVVQEGDNAPVYDSVTAVHNSAMDQYPLFTEDPASYGCLTVGSSSYCEARISGIEGYTNNIRVSHNNYSTKYVPFTNRSAGTDPQHIMTAVLGIPRDRDVTSPYIVSQYPEPFSTNSASIHPYVLFNKAMDPTTVKSSTLTLCADDSCSVTLPADITITEGGTRATIVPAGALADGRLYWVRITTGVKDLAGHQLTGFFGTEQYYPFGVETAPLAVTQISTVANTGGNGIDSSVGAATANGMYENGFAWIFHITAPMNEDTVQLKFSDFVSGSHTIAATNIRYCSNQAQNGSRCSDESEGTWKNITAADTYGTGIFVSDHDLDPSVAGRQVEIRVEMSVPEGTHAGSYSGSYGVVSTAPLG